MCILCYYLFWLSNATCSKNYVHFRYGTWVERLATFHGVPISNITTEVKLNKFLLRILNKIMQKRELRSESKLLKILDFVLHSFLPPLYQCNFLYFNDEPYAIRVCRDRTYWKWNFKKFEFYWPCDSFNLLLRWVLA